MDTAKIIVQRIPDVPPVTSFSYVDSEHPDRLSHFKAREGREEFDMTPEQATAAIATGGFQVKEDSKSETEEVEIESESEVTTDTVEENQDATTESV